MPLQPLAPRRLYRQIADQVRGLIRAGEFPVGSRLPAERDLAVQLGVSRPSVREALIALEVEGLVAVRMGSGVIVIARESAPSATPVDAPFGPFEIIRARQVIECELAAMAAQLLDGPALAGLQQALALMRADVAAGRAPVQGDRLFHLRIAEAADNGPLLRTVTALYDERNTPLFEQLGQHYETLPTWREALDEHQAVLDAITRRDPAAARAAMHAHLQQSHDRLAGLLPAAGGLAHAA
ncbi:MAG: FadR family transcriptional regulator [Burkholderiaceae bacterium]|jgi:GntR family transcriptional repressor for pyruvate dehydrogenase complex|nr:FadR family transcriptional regulator [Burkholderiaceae bacterium]